MSTPGGQREHGAAKGEATYAQRESSRYRPAGQVKGDRKDNGPEIKGDHAWPELIGATIRDLKAARRFHRKLSGLFKRSRRAYARALSREERRLYWEKQLLPWERARYSLWAALNPFAWTVRARLADLLRILRQEVRPGDRLLDLGCGSGVLGARLADLPFSRYLGIDFSQAAIAQAQLRLSRLPQPERFRFEAHDVTEVTDWAEADIVVASGLADWIAPEELASLLVRLRTRTLVLTYTEAQAGASIPAYRLYHRFFRAWIARSRTVTARLHTEAEVRAILEQAGFLPRDSRRGGYLNPGRIVTATRR